MFSDPNPVMFKSLSVTSWEAERTPYDFHIRLECDEYIIDVFDSDVENPDEAYLTSHTCDTWEQVERYCQDCDGVAVL